MAKASRYPDVAPDAPLRTLADAVLRTLWDAMLSESSAAVKGEDVEAVHDMRVAIRRLRSALRTFGDCYEPKACKKLSKRMRRLGRRLGIVRDADVHLAVLQSALAEAATEERAGIAFVIEQVGELRGRALADTAALLPRHDTAALERVTGRG